MAIKTKPPTISARSPKIDPNFLPIKSATRQTAKVIKPIAHEAPKIFAV